MYKKILGGLILIILVIGFFMPSQRIEVEAQENLMMHKAYTDKSAQEQISKMDMTNNYLENLGDFTANYVSDTYFEIKMNGKIFYNQGYYLVVNQTGEKVFCLEPDVMIGVIQKETLDEGKYSELDDATKVEIKSIIQTGLEVYDQTKDEEYLVATQILVWREVGAQILDLSQNIKEKTLDLDKIKNDLRDKLNSVTEENELEEETLSSTIDSATTTSLDNSQTDVSTANVEENILTDSQTYETTLTQYVTEGQDVATVSPNVGFDIVQQVSDENENSIAEPGEILTYDLTINNNMEATVDFLVIEDSYNKYLSPAKDQYIEVSGKSYRIEDLVSSNFIIEGLESGSNIEFSFDVVVDENYDGEIIKNEIKVCNTQDDGCASSETKIMGRSMSEVMGQNPYAKISEDEVSEDKISVNVIGADPYGLMNGEADVNLYLVDELIASQSLKLNEEEQTEKIVFEDGDKYQIEPDTEYTITVEGEYEDYETSEYVETILKDNSAQKIEASIDIKTDSIDPDLEVGNIKVSSELLELTTTAVKGNISLSELDGQEIESGKIIFIKEGNNDKKETDFSSDEIADLLDGNTVEVKNTELISNTRYNVNYQFFDSEGELLASGDLGNIITDVETPYFNLIEENFNPAIPQITGRVQVENSKAITNSSNSKTTVTLSEEDEDGNIVGTPQLLPIEILETTDYVNYDFTPNIVANHSYIISIRGEYNVDNMFDSDADEGFYDIELITYDSVGTIIESSIMAIYNKTDSVTDQNSIHVEFEIQNPDNQNLGEITVAACETSVGNCTLGIATKTTSVGNIYEVTISGLSNGTTYDLFANGSLVGNIVGVNNEGYTTKEPPGKLLPPSAIYEKLNVGKIKLSATLQIEDQDGVADLNDLPIVQLYYDNNEVGVFGADDIRSTATCTVSKKRIDTTPTDDKTPFNVECSGLELNTDYIFLTKVTYASTYNVNVIESKGEYSFSTGGLIGYIYAEYNVENSTVTEDGLVTEFELIDDNKEINALGEVSVYTDINHNGIVDDVDKKIDANVDITPKNGMNYEVEISGLEDDTFYQLHNEVASADDRRVYEIDSINNVFKTDYRFEESKGGYNLYIEPIKNSVDSYTKNTIGVEVGLTGIDLDVLENIEVKFVNKNNMMDTQVISLTDNQIRSLKNGETIELYVTELTPASEYMVYAILNDGRNTQIVSSYDNIYTDYEEPELNVTGIEITDTGVNAIIDVKNDKSLVESINVVNKETQENYQVDNKTGEVSITNLQPNKNYKFVVVYNYMLDSEKYLLSMVSTSEISYELSTLENDRKEIETCMDLQNIQNDLTTDYYLVKDIDCDGYEFNPISSFDGSLYGNNKEINNLTITKPDMNNVGFISKNNGTINDIVFNNLNIQGNDKVGLVGSNLGEIDNIKINYGNIEGTTYVGSIAGQNNGVIRKVDSSVNLVGEDYVNGIAGNNEGNLVNNSFDGNIESLGEHVENEAINENIILDKSVDEISEESDNILDNDSKGEFKDDEKVKSNRMNDDNLYNYIKSLIEN